MSFRPQKCQSSLVALTRLLFQHLSLLCCVELSFDLVSLAALADLSCIFRMKQGFSLHYPEKAWGTVGYITVTTLAERVQTDQVCMGLVLQLCALGSF